MKTASIENRAGYRQLSLSLDLTITKSMARSHKNIMLISLETIRNYPLVPRLIRLSLLSMIIVSPPQLKQTQAQNPSAQNPSAQDIAQRPTEAKTLPKPQSLNTPLSDEEKAQSEIIYVSPEEKIKSAFGPPPQAKAISSKNLWVDLKRKRVYVDGYVTMREGPLEMFACPVGTKEHEAIIATIAPSSEVHAALLAVGSKSGTPVQFLPDFVPATGQRIRIWICYRDEERGFKAVDAKTWVMNSKSKKVLSTDWVFSGSGFWRDPNDGREYYRADGGDMICVSNFSTAMLDLPIASSAEANSLQFSPNTPLIPTRGTAVRMVLTPIPIDTPVASEKETTVPGEVLAPPTQKPSTESPATQAPAPLDNNDSSQSLKASTNQKQLAAPNRDILPASPKSEQDSLNQSGSLPKNPKER